MSNIRPTIARSCLSKQNVKLVIIANTAHRVAVIIQVLLKDHYYDIQRRHGYVTAEMVRNAYIGITQREESLLKIYEQYLEDTKKLVGLSKADPTYKKYERMYRRVVEFMKKKYNTRIYLYEKSNFRSLQILSSSCVQNISTAKTLHINV